MRSHSYFQAFRRPFCLLLALTALVFCGCSSGLRPFRMAETEDPFLNNPPVELVDGSDNREDRDDGSEDSRDDFGEASGMAAATPEQPATSPSGRGADLGTDVASELALFAEEPGSGGGQIAKAGHAGAEPLGNGSGGIQRNPPPTSVQSGLGDASPWESSPVRQAPEEPGVLLQFEAGQGGPQPGHSFGTDTGEFRVKELSESDFSPLNAIADRHVERPRNVDVSGFDAGPDRVDTGGFGRVPAANASDEPSSDAERSKPTMRDRFSRLGARFGLGDDAEGVRQPPAPIEDAATGNCLDDLIATAESRLLTLNYSQLDEAGREAYLRDHVNLRLYYLANDQHERALDAIPGIAPAEQEFWTQIFWSLSEYHNAETTPDRTERITHTVGQLRTALHRLQELARLQLRNASFCQQIDGYGRYTRFESDVFRPGQPVLVYAEIENFKSEPTTSGSYRTLLRSTLEIFPQSDRGEAVDSVTLQAVEDICRNPRRDYFNSYNFAMPNDIQPGRYILRLTVDDQLSGKAATQTVSFSIR